MSDSSKPDVFAAIRVLGVELIDGGRTLAVRLEKATGTEAVLLLAQPVADELFRQMAELQKSAD
ncbi:hypothetical protein [Methylobacterium flocculans]|uniref:hypothetical protein n=1 Tax=Methylobacterium flocculans TaxID=2984843 RepID=UPI0021F3397F|nr:hypothetical protein [Methylobacterium sp. FF17]